MDERIAQIKEMLAQVVGLVDEIVAEQEQVEGEGEPELGKEEYLAKPESERLALDQKNVMTRKMGKTVA